MSFEVSADAYGRFMGRYSEPLAAELLRLATPQPGQRALDVGCGPGALTAVLVRRLGVERVSAVDPSAQFIDAIAERFPGIHARQGSAEQLPFSDGTFDFTAAQLVVHFMTDPVVGLTEMGRVTRPSGLVAASVWDHAGGVSPLSTFWRAACELDPQARDESALAGARPGHLAQLFAEAGFEQIEATKLSVRVGYAGFAEWWEPFTLGIGPAGAYVAGLDAQRTHELAARCASMLPSHSFEIEAAAWTVLGRPRAALDG